MAGAEERVPEDSPGTLRGFFTSIEICAGAGGQAIGLHEARFRHLALVEIDRWAGQTLVRNVAKRKGWEWEKEHCDVLVRDVKDFRPERDLERGRAALAGRELDLLAGGVPCPPFSHAGKQLGDEDERDLFPEMLRLVRDLRPRAVLIENVRGIMDAKFDGYREWIREGLERGGLAREGDEDTPGEPYTVVPWKVLEASDFGVPQLRPRALLVAFRNDVIRDLKFEWPTATHEDPVPVVDALADTMRDRYAAYFGGPYGERARAAYDQWRDKAARRHAELQDKSGGIAPTLVGGSKKHGGADLGPSRAKTAWLELGVSGLGVANDPDICAEKKSEDRDLFRPQGPMLTVQQAAIIQGFPADWKFEGGKTARYRQVGNAFPPPVAAAVGRAIAEVLEAADERDASEGGGPDRG
ncbi:DNA cytosine methyltransferase [Streptomyces sp. JNUCC 64]